MKKKKQTKKRAPKKKAAPKSKLEQLGETYWAEFEKQATIIAKQKECAASAYLIISDILGYDEKITER